MKQYKVVFFDTVVIETTALPALQVITKVTTIKEDGSMENAYLIMIRNTDMITSTDANVIYAVSLQ